MDKRTKKTLSVDAALLRLRKYCSYTERTKAEVKKKLANYSMAPGEEEIVMEKLIADGFLNETRFASAFAGGKFRMKKWGKRKIEVEMKKKGLSGDLIKKGLQELPENDYADTLEDLLKKKLVILSRKLEKDDSYEAKQVVKQKLVRFALQKGYEMDMVMERVSKMKI